MKNSRKRYHIYWCLGLIALGLFLIHFFIQETSVKYITAIAVITIIALIMRKGLQIDGMSDIIGLVLPEAGPILIGWLSDIPLTDKLREIYTAFMQTLSSAMGKESAAVTISNEMCTAFTLLLVIFLFESWNQLKDHTAMKRLRGSKDKELKEKNFEEKSEMFCEILQQWITEKNRESDWNENQFTPLEAEVEVDHGGKRKKKYEDLLKCLKNNRRSGTVYLVLGVPGSGKSVSMRKLCLDLLKETKKTGKIPLYINLKEWNEDWNLDHMPGKKDLIAFIRTTLEEKSDFFVEGFLNEYFLKMLDDGRWYFIFDSFDEMPCLMGNRNCQDLIDGISALLYQLMTGPNQSVGWRIKFIYYRRFTAN